MRRAALGLVVGLVALLCSCVLVTGGTDGYSAVDASGGGACQRSSDCSGGQICCYELTSTLPVTSCQSSCTPWQEACGIASDCAEAGACMAQSCVIDGGLVGTVTVTTCGVIPFCTQ